ncbi:aminotransferase class I/II-fold pyridoxal phosphate-dependent enzyme [Opitutales bacterium]|nr:aminotransferase class I/II-fold pyridoxal phosphate-dependent enzyme [Opitutales bacterium]MDA8806029.1 aminotransferase class I/II-fold pyridoxal phosphate-dependent enzyme [Opitutales bacterium]
MGKLFSKQKNNGIWNRILSDDSTRLRLKYDAYYHIFDDQTGTRVTKDGKEYVMLSSNDYLGLSQHPKIKEAGIKALQKWGSSTTGARLANGGRIFHRALEEDLADFLGMEACHVFSAGYLACASAITGFVDRNDLVFADKNLHSSLWSGIKLSGAKCERFAHNHPEHLREILSHEDPKTNKALVVEGIYSMEGHIARLPELLEVAKEFGAFLILDDAHGIGVLGDHGKGTANHFDLTDQIDVICGSFSKSFSGMGGFVCASKDAIDYMRSHSKQTIFSAALSPVSTACAHAALGIIRSEPEHRKKLEANLSRYRKLLDELNLDTWNSESPAVPIVLGKKEKVYYFWKALLEKGVYAIISVAPGVPPGKDLIRTAISAAHTEEDFDLIEEAFRYAVTKI